MKPASVSCAYLATVGSHRVNGVAQLHSKLLKQTVMHDFAELWPDGRQVLQRYQRSDAPALRSGR
jgi:glucan phosphorylase